MNQEMEKAIREDGERLGYPKYCVDAFVDTFDNFNDELHEDGRQHRKLFGTGCIPCIKCNESKTEQEFCDEIRKNRTFPSPFPMSVKGHMWISEDLRNQIYAAMKEKALKDFKEDLDRIAKSLDEQTAMDIVVSEIYQFGEVYYEKQRNILICLTRVK